MQIPQNQSATSAEYCLPPGRPGIPLNATEVAVRNLAINMLWQLDPLVTARVVQPEHPQLRSHCAAVSGAYIDCLIDVLDPSSRSVQAGNVRDAHYSDMERVSGLNVASLCATLDPTNPRAWSMIYQLLPDDQTHIFVQNETGLQPVNRRNAERTMFDQISRNPAERRS